MNVKEWGIAEENPSVVALSLFVALLCGCFIVGHLLHSHKWILDSITALFIGLISGAIVLVVSKWKSSRILVFNEELFFIYLLPPIIFNAGFQVKKKNFFQNFVMIMLFGAVGTFISFLVIFIGAMMILKRLDIGPLEVGDYLAIGTIFSATDSVCTLQILNQDETPLLYSLVFGEGVVNDATSIVLFNAVNNYNVSQTDAVKALRLFTTFLYLFFFSTLLGIIAGLLSAYVMKTLYFGRHSTDREIAAMILIAYLSYMLAELFNLSGILTVFFCGLLMSHYTWHNVTESSRTTTKHLFATLSFIAETFIFLYVGMDALDIEKWKLVQRSPGIIAGVSGALLGLICVGRAVFVFPICFLLNFLKRTQNNKIVFRQQLIIWWAGLMRGAVSIALAYNQFTASGHTIMQDHAIMITSTIIVVLFSTVVYGLLTRRLIKLILNLDTIPRQRLALEPSSPKDLVTPLNEHSESNVFSDANIFRTSNSQWLLQAPVSRIHYFWHQFDNTYMRPVFGGQAVSS